MIFLQETPLDFAGDNQWVVYANQVDRYLQFTMMMVMTMVMIIMIMMMMMLVLVTIRRWCKDTHIPSM